jgi:hypothetical protein
MSIMDPQQMGLAAPSKARGVVGPAMPPWGAQTQPRTRSGSICRKIE